MRDLLSPFLVPLLPPLFSFRSLAFATSILSAALSLFTSLRPLLPKLQACEPTVPCNCYLGNDLAFSSLALSPPLPSSLSLFLALSSPRRGPTPRLHLDIRTYVHTYLRTLARGASSSVRGGKIIDLAADLAALDDLSPSLFPRWLFTPIVRYVKTEMQFQVQRQFIRDAVR